MPMPAAQVGFSRCSPRLASRMMSRPSIAQCSWVLGNLWVRPGSTSIFAPVANAKPAEVRIAKALKPTPFPTRPAAVRP